MYEIYMLSLVKEAVARNCDLDIEQLACIQKPRETSFVRTNYCTPPLHLQGILLRLGVDHFKSTLKRF